MVKIGRKWSKIGGLSVPSFHSFFEQKHMLFERVFRLFPHLISVPAVCDCEITVQTGLTMIAIRHSYGRNQEKAVKTTKRPYEKHGFLYEKGVK